MKDFSKTIAFVRDFNGFFEYLPKLWNGLYKSEAEADELINRLRECKDATRLKGEHLANELKEVCPDVAQMQQYYEIWCSVLSGLNTIIDDEELTNETQWAYRLDDDQKGCLVAGLIRKMTENYKDVLEGKRWIEQTYHLNTHTGTQETTQTIYGPTGVEQEDAGETNVPHDVLRLFGDKRNFDNYITACKDQCPKEIARLYVRKYGKIQLDREKGIVTTLYNFLHERKILSCTKGNFQKHYREA